MTTRITLPLLLGTLLLAGVTRAASPNAGGVHDQAGFFSTDAVAQANQQIQSAEQQYGKSLRVETYPSIPPDRASSYSPQNKAKFFADWAHQRGVETGLAGAIVLITKDPSYLHVEVGERTGRRAITMSDRDRMRDAMLTAFKQKDYDRGLLAGVAVFTRGLEQNLGSSGTAAAQGAAADSTPAYPASPERTPRRSFGMGSLLVWGVVILLGFWFVRRLIGGSRAGHHGPHGQQHSQQQYDNAPPGQYGGGGFGRGFGGGILGGLLGGWLGGQMMNRGQQHDSFGSSAAGSAPPPGGAGFDQSDFAPGPGDTGGGGDFGGDGGDSGGGDTGGGDF